MEQLTQKTLPAKNKHQLLWQCQLTGYRYNSELKKIGCSLYETLVLNVMDFL